MNTFKVILKPTICSKIATQDFANTTPLRHSIRSYS